MSKILKVTLSIVAVIAICLSLVCCNGSYDTSRTGKGTGVKMFFVEREINSMSASDFVEASGKTDFVKISIKGYGDIVVVLRGDIAPKTVKNFKSLVADGFYNGTVFHRVIKDFMIQGGGYTVNDGKLSEKKADTIEGEFNSNGFGNNLKHVRGVISMARLGDKESVGVFNYDTAHSQFFIMHATTESLDGDYATFGYVLAGMDVVDAIAECEVKTNSMGVPQPVEDVVMESVTFVEPKE